MTTFGVQASGQFPHGLPDRTFLRDTGQIVEGLGFDAVWVGEHLSFENPILESTVALSYLAACTERVLLGTGILLLPLRHPTLVAKQIASLDFLVPGRLVLGVGVGGEGAKDFEAVEVLASERGKRTDESLDAIRALWSGAEAAFHGSYFDFEGVTIEPRPAPGNAPPIWVGGRSEAALRRVASRGDGWLGAFCSPDRYARARGLIRTEASVAGRDPDEISLGHAVHVYVGQRHQQAVSLLREHLSLRYGQPFPAHVVERYMVVGTVDECRARVAEFIEAGVEHLVFVPGVEVHEFPEQLRRISEEVLGDLRL